jgi:hypothetical protein
MSSAIRLEFLRSTASRPPQEVNGGHGPVASIMLDAVAEASGVAVGDVVSPDHVHDCRMHPGQASHLHNDPAGAGRAVDHAVSSGHPTARERLDPGCELAEPVEERLIRIMPLERKIIAEDRRVIHQRLRHVCGGRHPDPNAAPPRVRRPAEVLRDRMRVA